MTNRFRDSLCNLRVTGWDFEVYAFRQDRTLPLVQEIRNAHIKSHRDLLQCAHVSLAASFYIVDGFAAETGKVGQLFLCPAELRAQAGHPAACLIIRQFQVAPVSVPRI